MMAALYSGGKDSTLAVHRMHDRKTPVELLITMVPENEFSYMFHRPNVKYTALQAQAMGIPHIFAKTAGEKETELEDLEEVLRENRVTELVCGGVASRYQSNRINSICGKLGIVHHSPLWGIDPLLELKEIAMKFNAIIVRVSAGGMDQTFLGKRIDEKMIGQLEGLKNRYGINMSFEGGEAESFVLDAPLFSKKVVVISAHIVRRTSSEDYIIDEAALEEKRHQKGY